MPILTQNKILCNSCKKHNAIGNHICDYCLEPIFEKQKQNW